MPETVTHSLNGPSVDSKHLDLAARPGCIEKHHPRLPPAAFPAGRKSPTLHPPGCGPALHASSHRRSNTEIIPRSLSSETLPQLHAGLPVTEYDSKTLGRRLADNNSTTTRKKIEDGARLLADWFQGKSEPVNWGMVRDGDSQPASGADYTNTDDGSNMYAYTTRAQQQQQQQQQQRSTPTSPLKHMTTTTSRFPFFGLTQRSSGGDRQPELPEPADDEFLNLDVTDALYPMHSSDLTAEEAFEMLRDTADSLLRRLQAAYKQRTFALHEALADKREKQEESEESRTRIGHLKAQLNGMADKVLEQQKVMQAMAEELKRTRQQAEEAAQRRSVVLLTPTDDEGASEFGKDLHIARRHLKRCSGGTFTSDSGFESGDESLAESIWSRRDTVQSASSTSVTSGPGTSHIAPSPSATSTPGQTRPRDLSPSPTPTPTRTSAYDRVLKGLTSTSLANSLKGNSSKCTICHGVPASEAWSVMGILKEENSGLKTRLSELEAVVDDCLSIVGP